jgi:transmembrane sensor
VRDLSRSIQAARDHVGVVWDERRAGAAAAGIGAKRARRARRRALGVGGAVVAAALIALLFRGAGSSNEGRVASAPSAAPSGSAAGAVLDLADGSVVRPGPAAIVRPRTLDERRVEIDLVRGRADFDVAHRAERQFLVLAGAVAVEVIGTAFTVERRDARAFVSVDRGRVRVTWTGGDAELGAGESGTFPPAPAPASSSAAAPASAPAEAEPPPATSGPPSSAKASWRTLAKAGDYDAAYAAMRAEPSAPVRDAPEELLLAADVARLSGHPAQAVDPLRRVVRGHRGDPRAALAAFTLGRVLLDQLGRPREAADAFADARALGGGGLTEEALAREVEARSRAGESERARSLAEQYTAKYPEGRRLRSVRKFGGLE